MSSIGVVTKLLWKEVCVFLRCIPFYENILSLSRYSTLLARYWEVKGVASRTVSNYEENKQQPTSNLFRVICSVNRWERKSPENRQSATAYPVSDAREEAHRKRMQPRPYPSEVQPHYKEGTLVKDDNQIGYLPKAYSPYSVSEKYTDCCIEIHPEFYKVADLFNLQEIEQFSFICSHNTLQRG